MTQAAHLRYDWYQSETNVFISIFIKNIQKDQVEWRLNPQSIHLLIPSLDIEWLLEPLFDKMEPSQIRIDYLSTKLELVIPKLKSCHWKSLLSDQVKEEEKVPSYPSSSRRPHDWTRVDEPDEKPQGEAALNHLFQSIYQNASEETRRAMNKSFLESGGTCLSTNWEEVGKGRVEMKPPEGMEVKKYEL